MALGDLNVSGKEVKTKRELLSDIIQMLDERNICFFKLRNGKTCFGSIESVNDNFLRFDPEYTREECQDWENSEYQEDDEGCFIPIPLQYIDIDSIYYWNKESFCFINPQWSVEQKCWLYNELVPGSLTLPTYLTEPIKDNKCLKRIGFWQSDNWELYYPHPKYLVEAGWRESDRSKIIAYLKAGHECAHWCGSSYCRFGCFSIELLMASTLDLTDGEWIWPEGLAHYVEKHNVCLPDAFVETMQKNSWSIPAKLDFKSRHEVGESSSYWVNWAIEYVKTKRK